MSYPICRSNVLARLAHLPAIRSLPTSTPVCGTFVLPTPKYLTYFVLYIVHTRGYDCGVRSRAPRHRPRVCRGDENASPGHYCIYRRVTRQLSVAIIQYLRQVCRAPARTVVLRSTQHFSTARRVSIGRTISSRPTRS